MAEPEGSQQLRAAEWHNTRVPVDALPDPDGLKDRPGGRYTDPLTRAEARRCATIRADFILGLAGARTRADAFPPELICTLATGVVGFMLEQVLTGAIVAKDAKQALDIANIALKITDKVTAFDPAPGADNTASTRAAKIAEAQQLHDTLRERASSTLDAAAEAAGVGGFDPDEWEPIGEDDARPTLRAV